VEPPEGLALSVTVTGPLDRPLHEEPQLIGWGVICGALLVTVPGPDPSLVTVT
jgi:hypothetical protein